MRAHLTAALVAATACLVEVATARYECHPELIAGQYPFCVNVPDIVTHEHHDGRFPTVLYLGGSGTFGRPDDIETSTTWDGLGKILHDYRQGNRSDVAQLVAEHFVTIIPIAPKKKPDGTVNKHYRPEHLDKIVAYALGNYPIDLKRFYTVGYSAGCRGVIRYNVFRPFFSAAAICAAAGAEKADGQYIQQDAEPETFSKLDRIASLPINIIGGTNDQTAPVEPKQTFDELFRLGSRAVTMTLYDSDHEGLQTEPWTAELMKWLWSQSKGVEGQQDSELYRRSLKSHIRSGKEKFRKSRARM